MERKVGRGDGVETGVKFERAVCGLGLNSLPVMEGLERVGVGSRPCCPRRLWPFELSWQVPFSGNRGEERTGSPSSDSVGGTPNAELVFFCAVAFAVSVGCGFFCCWREIGVRVGVGVPEPRLVSGSAVLWKT